MGNEASLTIAPRGCSARIYASAVSEHAPITMSLLRSPTLRHRVGERSKSGSALVGALAEAAGQARQGFNGLWSVPTRRRERSASVMLLPADGRRLRVYWLVRRERWVRWLSETSRSPTQATESGFAVFQP